MSQPGPKKFDPYTFIGMVLAVAILTPIGWWLRQNEVFGFGDWVASLFQ